MLSQIRNLTSWLSPRSDRRPARRTRLGLQQLEARDTPAVTAFFNTDVLSVTGDGAANNILVAADTAGRLTVTENGAAVPIQVTAGSPTRASLRLVTVSGKSGDDRIVLDRTLNTGVSGPTGFFAPNATLLGDDGTDVLDPNIGGFLGTVDANGVIQGTILGNVTMDGGSGDDFLDSGFGNDIMLGGSGNDTLQWLPGTLTDRFDGGSGIDNSVVVGNGNNQGDAFVLGRDPRTPGGVLFQRTNLVQFSIQIVNSEQVTLQTQSGDDRITINDLRGTQVQRVLADGGDGNDGIDGGSRIDPFGTQNAGIALTLIGGNGNDSVGGGGGNDVIDGGAGDDFLQGYEGDDRITGGDGNDSLFGYRGADFLDGGAGNDRIDPTVADLTLGDGAVDTVIGGAGADVLFFYVTDPVADLFPGFNPGEGDIRVEANGL